MALTLGIDVAVRAERQTTLARDGATVWRGRSGHGRPIWNGCGRTCVACQGDGTTSLPRAWDHPKVSSSIDLAF
jgi:hypothetical protein